MKHLKLATCLLALTAFPSGCWVEQALPVSAYDTDSSSDADTDGDADGDSDTDSDTDSEGSFWDNIDLGFRAVWGTGSNDVFFGGVDTPTLHWDGLSFEDNTDDDHWVFAITGDSNAVYYAGSENWESGSQLPPPRAMVARWEEPYWEDMYSGPEGRPILDLSLVPENPGTLYGVGMEAFIVSNADGDWNEIDENVLWWEERPYHSIWMDDSQSIYVGGVRDSCLVSVSYACGGIVRWNGIAWNEMIIQDYNWGEPRIPLDMQRTDDGVLWAAASGGVVYRIGAGWSESYQLFEDSDLRGMWAREWNDVWVAGDNGALARWDGAAWTLMPQDEEIRFYDIWGSQSTTGMDDWANDVWAVGGVETGEDDWMSIIMHFDGYEWTVMYPFGA